MTCPTSLSMMADMDPTFRLRALALALSLPGAIASTASADAQSFYARQSLTAPKAAEVPPASYDGRWGSVESDQVACSAGRTSVLYTYACYVGGRTVADSRCDPATRPASRRIAIDCYSVCSSFPSTGAYYSSPSSSYNVVGTDVDDMKAKALRLCEKSYAARGELRGCSLTVQSPTTGVVRFAYAKTFLGIQGGSPSSSYGTCSQAN